jgi:hypothetical protein|uniref:Glycosyltransferase family 2 protein n=1 Tax=Bellilinea caldifistulae TaxID=360411 RepID=A0A7C4Q5J2_9CHLR
MLSDKKKLEVCAVILNWNRPDLTCKCIDSLLIQEQVVVKPVIVDNGSTDQSIRILNEKYGSNVKIIPLPRNYGFATGVNFGIRYALDQKYEYILVINNDAFLETGSLWRMMEVLNDCIGVVAPVIYEYPDTQKIWSTGGYINSLVLEPLDAHHRSEDVYNNQILKRTFLSGCILLFTRSLLLRVGLFDERFFMYYEDLDLCYRILKSDYQMAVCKLARGYHWLSASSGGKDNPFEKYHMGRSSGIYFRKHVRGLRWIPVLIFRIVSWCKMTFKLFFSGKFRSLLNFYRGLYDGWVKDIV